MNPSSILQLLEGNWNGSCRTWLRPDELADDSPVHGTISRLSGGELLRHRYNSEFQDRPRIGEETIAYSNAQNTFQIAWFDTFHMSDGMMFSTGIPTENGFEVRGVYSMSPNMPLWGWKTKFEFQDEDNFTITAYNVTPQGEESKAVETVYSRESGQ